jgi:phosphatidylserine synthase
LQTYLTAGLLSLLLFAFFSNIPLGYFREGSRKYSVRWFVFIHLSIPFIVGLRVSNDISWRAIPFTLILAFAGQWLGGRAHRRRRPLR